MTLADKRVLVVGASSGLGRAVGVSAARRGARVVLAARRLDRVQDAVAEAGGSTLGVECDVRESASREALVARAVEHLGGLDALVFATGRGALKGLADADDETWQDVLATNVIGASQLTKAVVPHLSASRGAALYFSSVSGTTTPPWPGLALYAVSKAALERLVACWQVEHPDVRFTTLVVGPAAGDASAPSEFGRDWEPELAVQFPPRWMQMGLMDGRTITTTDLCDAVTAILATGATMSRVVIEPGN